MGENKLHEIRYLCETITPMFLGDHTGRGAELRPPSIKGAMRFWWRATQSYKSIAELKTAEGEIFGTPEGEGKKSKLLITAKILSSTKPTNNSLPEKKNLNAISNGQKITADSIKYLAFGKTPSGSTKNNNFQPLAFYFEPVTKFEVVFLVAHEHIKTVNEAFHLVAKYGGLGGKSRNGFGSFRILEIEGTSLFPASADLYSSNFTDLPDYPAFSIYSSEIDSNKTYNKWEDAMGALGKVYYEAKNELGKSKSTKYSLIPYKKEYLGIIRGSQIKKGDLRLERDQKFERIAKPYFFRIDKTADNKFKIRVLFLPSKFLEGFRNNQNDTMLNESQKEYLELLTEMTNNLSTNLI